MKLSHVQILICRNGSVEVRGHSIKLPEVELHGGHNGEEDPQTGNADDRASIASVSKMESRSKRTSGANGPLDSAQYLRGRSSSIRWREVQ
eukprot:jgi/Tetstr1/446506/TSEL_034034.t1